MIVFVKFCDTYLGGDWICIESLYSLAVSILPEMIYELGIECPRCHHFSLRFLTHCVV